MTPPDLPPDTLIALASADVQRQAARMAQDAFTRLFRLSLDSDLTALDAAVGELAKLSRNWARAGADDDARALRLALLVSGMDQWGLAYTQAFDLKAITGLSALLGQLRTDLDARDDARFAQQFAALEHEGNAIDFKMELRRNIHLALWHALVACAPDIDTDGEDTATTHTAPDDAAGAAEAQRIAAALGGLLLALDRKMPQLGWRLMADTLAHMQIRCLEVGAGETALDRTQTLFSSLRKALPEEHGAAIFKLANQAAASWQQARQSPVH